MKPPLYLINGPLGSGKTTLLKFLLTTEAFKHARVIENEFASANIDAEQLAKHQAEVRSIAGLCVCCSTGNELLTALEELAESSSEPVIVESSGVANSLVLVEKLTASQLFDYYDLRHTFFVLDGAEVNARPDLLHLYREELTAADTVLLSKTDLLEPEDTLHIMNKLTSLRNGPIESMYFGEVDLRLMERPSRMVDYYLNHQDAAREHEHESSFSIIGTGDKNISPHDIQSAWSTFVTTYGAERMKGAIAHNGEVWHVDATPSQCRITPAESLQESLSLVIIGAEAHRINDTHFMSYL